MNAPIKLVAVDGSIASSYNKAGGTGGPRANLTALAKLGKAGVAHPEMAAGLLALSNAVAAAGGDLRITECHRDVGVQEAARAKYDRWVAAGKPKPGTPGFDAATMKAAYVAQPGRSGHNAGRSIDIHLAELKFPGVPANLQLDKLWEIAIPLGWKPIIKTADEGASEAWHLDFPGELSGVMSRLGYEQWALCGAILVGHGDLSNWDAVIQALLSRAGFNVGNIDGQAGTKTKNALADALRINLAAAEAIVAAKDESIIPALLALPAK
jgi:D-alanyl-D-alanine dipeptidase